MSRAPSLGLSFLSWACFALVFSTVFQTFITAFLIDTGCKTPIKNLEGLFASGTKLAYPPEYSFIFVNADETEISKVKRIRANCQSYNFLQTVQNIRRIFELWSAICLLKTIGLLLENMVVLRNGLTMIIFHGDPLMRRVNGIIDHVVEALL
jgi:hypothetical protein